MASWLTNYIEEMMKEMKEPRETPGWFPIQAIEDVPYIEYKGLTEEECVELWFQIQNVLRISRNENEYQDVSIAYRLDADKKPKDYIKKFGDINLASANEDFWDEIDGEDEMVVISFHNHSNPIPFSIQDFILFCQKTCIKLMVIVNPKGEVAYLLKPQKMDVQHIIFKHILEVCPDYYDKIIRLQKEKNKKEFEVKDIIEEIDDRQQIVNAALLDFQSNGIIYSPFSSKAEHFEMPRQITIDKMIKKGKIKVIKIDPYCENGEDGYEWKDPAPDNNSPHDIYEWVYPVSNNNSQT